MSLHSQNTLLSAFTVFMALLPRYMYEEQRRDLIILFLSPHCRKNVDSKIVEVFIFFSKTTEAAN
jgi:hypothetical protein